MRHVIHYQRERERESGISCVFGGKKLSVSLKNVSTQFSILQKLKKHFSTTYHITGVRGGDGGGGGGNIQDGENCSYIF